jgi:RTX calcium-binding nonapeptide repeat (4 copies)
MAPLARFQEGVTLKLGCRRASYTGLLLIGLTLIVPAPSAWGAGTCMRTGPTLDIDIEGDSALSFFTLSRDGSGQINLEESLLLGSNDIDCGDASVTNVDLINIQGSAFVEELAVQIDQGGFSPGATSEGSPADSEIEIRIGLGGGQDFALVQGTTDPDTLRLGMRGANLNGDGDGNDVVFRPNVEFPGFIGGEDNDVLTANGGHNTGGAMKTPVFSAGGLGNDVLRGGNASDFLTGQIGNDDLFGLGGNDNLGDNPAPGGIGNTTEDGNDRLVGGAGGDNLRAGDNSDDLEGGLGDDEEHGGGGSDTFDQGRIENGADRIFGGDGTDGVDFGNRKVTVIVRLDGKARDGKSGEGDSVGYEKDVEGAIGSRAADRLIGNSKDNFFRGGRGADFLDGKGGTDTCQGGPGNNTLVSC